MESDCIVEDDTETILADDRYANDENEYIFELDSDVEDSGNDECGEDRSCDEEKEITMKINVMEVNLI